MIYKNDPALLDRALRDYLIRMTISVIIGLTVALGGIWLAITDTSTRLIVVLGTVGIAVIASVIGVIIGQKSLRKNYEAFQIEISAGNIRINSHNAEKNIAGDSIKKISRNPRGTFFIYQGLLRKTAFTLMLADSGELEDELREIKAIESEPPFRGNLDYLSAVFLIAFMAWRIYPNYLYILIVGTLFLISGTISLK